MQIIQFITDHLFEILGTTLSVIYLILCIFQNNWCWLFGGLGAAFCMAGFYEGGLYADMSLQPYYIVISFYGWYNWKFGKKKEEEQLPVTTPTTKQWIWLAGFTVLIWGIYAVVLHRFTDSQVIVGDSFCTATAIVATYMVSRKYIENWLVFIVSDSVAVGLCIYKELYLFALLYAFYTIMAVVGYFDWRKSMLNHTVLKNKEY